MSPSSNETQVRALMDDRVKAVREKNAEAVMSRISPDILTFDLLNPLQYKGSDTVRKRVEEWFSSFQGPIDFEMRDLSVTAGDDVAFCHSLNGVHGTVHGTTPDGGKIDMWFRATVCCRKIDGKWLVTHEHSSEPFDMTTGKALLDLKP